MDTKISRIRRIRLSELDKRILCVLYKLPWAMDYHVALLVGEPVKYVRRRLQQLAEGGLIRRINMMANKTALNVITSMGISEAGFDPRNLSNPTFFNLEHDLGVIDIVVYLSTLEKNGKHLASFGSIITERDFQAVREMEQVDTRSDGKPIYKSRDTDIHAPDAYMITNTGYTAIEFERTLKTRKSNSQLKDNAIDLRKRFSRQIWVYGNNAVKNKLQEVRKEIREISMIGIEDIRGYLDSRVEQLPKTISSKSGIPATNRIGQTKDPIPLNRLPLRRDLRLEPAKEIRTTTVPVHSVENKNDARRQLALE